MIKYLISNGIGCLQSPFTFYIKDNELEIECPGCKYLRVNVRDTYPFKDNRVIVKDVKPGVYHFDAVLLDGSIVPFEPLVIANGITDFKGALLVHLQGEALDKRILSYEKRIRALEAQTIKLNEVSDLRAKINELIKEINELSIEIKKIAAGWDPSVTEEA